MNSIENNQAFLFDAFNMYYRQAEDAKASGNAEMQKKKLLLASETLLKLAKASTGQIKLARMERAQRLLEIAGKIGTNDAVAPKVQAKSKVDKKDKDGSGGNEDEELTKFEAATIPNIRFADVAGLEEVKEAVNTRIILPRKHPEIYKHFKKKSGGGILMYGPPGTGKTMIAKAIAAEAGAKFYAVKCSDIVSKWFGEAEKNIKALFDTARQEKDAVIFFDEFESLGAKRGGNSTVMARIIPELLAQIQGFSETDSNLLLLAATNRPWDIDSAFLRPGRFNELLYIPLPDFEARRELLERAFDGVALGKEVDLDEYAYLTEGYSGADLKEVVERAKDDPIMRAIEKGGLELGCITDADLKNALVKVKPSVDEKEIKEFQKFKIE